MSNSTESHTYWLYCLITGVLGSFDASQNPIFSIDSFDSFGKFTPELVLFYLRNCSNVLPTLAVCNEQSDTAVLCLMMMHSEQFNTWLQPYLLHSLRPCISSLTE